MAVAVTSTVNLRYTFKMIEILERFFKIFAQVRRCVHLGADGHSHE